MSKFHCIDPVGIPYHPEALEAKAEVGLSDLVKLDIRVGRVLAVTRNKKARDPAYVVEVDFGPKVGRLITSAKITNYSESELLGRFVVGVINLGVRKVADVNSQFLILGALLPDGEVKLVGFDDPAVVPGLSVG